jgi:hypothetical protein
VPVVASGTCLCVPHCLRKFCKCTNTLSLPDQLDTMPRAREFNLPRTLLHSHPYCIDPMSLRYACRDSFSSLAEAEKMRLTHMQVTSEKLQQCYIDHHRGFLFSFGIWENLITRCGKEANDEPHPHLPDRFWRPCALSPAITRRDLWESYRCELIPNLRSSDAIQLPC